MRLPVLFAMLFALCGVLIGVLTNVATPVLPPWVQQHQGYAWPALGLVVVLMVSLLVAEKRSALRRDRYDEAKARREQELSDALSSTLTKLRRNINYPCVIGYLS